MIVQLPCPVPADLERLVLGDMPDVEMEILEGHVSQCAHCLEVFRALTREDALVAAVRAGGQKGGIPRAAVDETLIARLCRLRQEWLVPAAPPQATPAAGSMPALEKAGDLSNLLAPPGAPDELGRIGPYGILRVLGSGGMGIVFAARQARPQRVVALKMIVAGRGVRQNRLDRFRGESEILARLRHPNIVQVHEVGEHDGRPYFTMEYAAGGSLAQKLAAAPLAPREAAEVLRTLSLAVHSAHAQGIVHRDLKPSNVLLAADGTLRIGDFGLAKQLEGERAAGLDPGDRTETGAILGTPSYMAPEQAGGPSKDVSPAADVYALGAILYECLTGRPPFKAATVLETLEQVRSRDPLPPGRLQPGLPRDLQTICLKCLEKEPRRRYASAERLADDLERFEAGKPILARRVRPWERAWKWARRKPAAAALILVSLLSTGALIVGVLAHNAQLRHAVDKAEQNADEAFRQKELARAHYHRARDTVEKMLKQFKELRLGEVAHLKELERRQLEDALAFYQGALQDQDDPDPAVRADAALAAKRAGDLQGIVGQPAKAVESFGRAIGLLDALPDEWRALPENRYLLVVCYNHRGLMMNQMGRWDDAARDHGAALLMLQAMIRAQPNSLQWREGLADTEHYLGALYQVSQKLAEAEPHHRRSATLFAELVRDRPDVEGYLAKLADTEVNLALLYQNTERPADAKRCYEQAEGRVRSLIERYPTEGGYALSLAALYTNWAYVLGAARENKPALAKLTRAVELAEEVLKKEPTHKIARSRALNAHGARAELYGGLGRWTNAAKEWDRVIELVEQPASWISRALRAVVLARAGAHVRAVTEVDALADDPKVSAEGRFELARACSLSAAQVGKDTQLDPAKRAALAERYGAQAVLLLKRLQADGYFTDAENAVALTTDPDLQVLRDRADFQKLLPQSRAEKK
jgi:tetratricopeptide (TPR) repeat protein